MLGKQRVKARSVNLHRAFRSTRLRADLLNHHGHGWLGKHAPGAQVRLCEFLEPFHEFRTIDMQYIRERRGLDGAVAVQR